MAMNKPFSFFLFAIFLSFSACVMEPPKPALTPLEIQGLQTREFEGTKQIVFASVMSVFQDLGYIIQSADLSTGFITAQSAARSNSGIRGLSNVTNVTQTSATAFVEEIADRTRVRLNFVNVNMRSYEQGQSDRQDTPILNAMTYQNAFERIENEIFVRNPN
jgi:hypothetical protein